MALIPLDPAASGAHGLASLDGGHDEDLRLAYQNLQDGVAIKEKRSLITKSPIEPQSTPQSSPHKIQQRVPAPISQDQCDCNPQINVFKSQASQQMVSATSALSVRINSAKESMSSLQTSLVRVS